MKNSRNYTPFVLSLLVGFSSLSIEVLWVRVISFSVHTVPQAFSYVLIVFLLGIAAGSFIGKRLCQSGKYDLYFAAALALMVAAVVDFASLRMLVLENRLLNIALYSTLIFITALLKSIVFPIAHHLGSNDSDRVAASVSYVYFGNIMGSTLGPLATTFIFLNWFTTAHTFSLIAGITGLASLLALSNASSKRYALAFTLIPALTISGVAFALPGKNIWYQLIDVGRTYAEQPGGHFRQTYESQYGVINIEASDTGDLVFGFGKYDGRINTDLMVNSNEIDRAYRVAGFHNEPANVLILGFSTGSWANVISWLPGVSTIDIIDINPDYAAMVKQEPKVAGILSDSRVDLHIDDGRRWLKRNPDRRFDLIVMNSSYYFRNAASHILSREMMELMQARLNTGGVVYFNTTGSPDAFATAADVFKYSYAYKHFVAASDSHFLLDRETTIERLAAMKNGDKYIFVSSPEEQIAMATMLAIPVVPYAQAEKTFTRAAELITDNTPVSEYRYGWLAGKLGLSDENAWPQARITMTTETRDTATGIVSVQLTTTREALANAE